MRLTKSVAVGAAAALFLTVLSVPGLQAQSSMLKVAIPFAFHVADKKFPAGDYTVQNLGAAIRISDREGHNATILTNAVWKKTGGERNEVVFTRYGNGDFFLTEARWVGYKTSRGLLKSKAETRLANNFSPELVRIAALVR